MSGKKYKYKEPGSIERALRPCAGECGRITRPTNMGIDMAPGTVDRRTGGMCHHCLQLSRGNPVRKTSDFVSRIDIPEEKVEEWRRSLEAWLDWRRNRPQRVVNLVTRM